MDRHDVPKKQKNKKKTKPKNIVLVNHGKQMRYDKWCFVVVVVVVVVVCLFVYLFVCLFVFKFS